MPRAKLSEYQAFAATMAPALCLALILAAMGRVDWLVAAALITLVAAGGWWFVRRGAVNRPPQPASSERPPAIVPQALLDQLPNPVILVDRARIVLASNRAARDVLGLGAAGRDLALSLRHPAILAAVDAALRGEPPIRDEVTLPLPLARTFTIHVGRMADGGDDKEAAVAIVLRDETRAKRAERSRADFVANASHELRSPLSALIGFIETLQGAARSDAEARTRFLEIMRIEAERMARLVEDLLSLSRVEINEHVPPRERIDLPALIVDTVNALALRARDKKMPIAVDCPADLPEVIGDRDQLAQVFHNLLANAVQYGRAGTEIRITAAAVAPSANGDPRQVAVAVADRGEGIAATHLPRLTERFYRVDAGRSREMGGTGLGLAIVKHIVNRHRGQLRIDSTLGVGSTFTVLLPAAPPGSTSGRRNGCHKSVTEES